MAIDLHDRIRCEEFAEASLLLDQGVDVNVRNFDGDTPLHHAAIHLSQEFATILLDSGADIEAPTPQR